MSIDTLVKAEQTESWLLNRLKEHQTTISLQEIEARFASKIWIISSRLERNCLEIS